MATWWDLNGAKVKSAVVMSDVEVVAGVVVSLHQVWELKGVGVVVDSVLHSKLVMVYVMVDLILVRSRAGEWVVAENEAMMVMLEKGKMA